VGSPGPMGEAEGLEFFPCLPSAKGRVKRLASPVS